MTVDDLNGVLEVEALSFYTPWSRQAFVQELTRNEYAYYLVLKDGARAVGYAGVWIILDEAHITNIAVHPDYRGRDLGKFLLISILKAARSRGARRATLEVRVSNSVAQRLYLQMGFLVHGIRRGYYTDTHEDAFIMWKMNLDDLPEDSGGIDLDGEACPGY
jgi:ribosomal-protein-alanine N-acetyltransferase